MATATTSSSPAPSTTPAPTPVSTAAAQLDSSGLVWFNELRISSLAWLPSVDAVVASTPPTTEQAAVKAASEEIKSILKLEPAQLTQQHLFSLEDLLILLRPAPDLKQWVSSLRDDYLAVFGAQSYQNIIPSLVPQVSTASTPDLQAEARRLQGELHWQAAIQPWAHRQRSFLMSGIVTTLGISLVVLLVVWFIGLFWKGFALLEFVLALFLLGAIGGCISTIQRIQSAALATPRAMGSIRYNEAPWGVWLSPLQGAIFALILTLILLAKVATPGSVVPDVDLQGLASASATNVPPPVTTKDTGDSNTPYNIACLGMSLKFASGKDIAILLLLAFAAGFSERMVPDMLSQLAAKEKV